MFLSFTLAIEEHGLILLKVVDSNFEKELKIKPEVGVGAIIQLYENNNPAYNFFRYMLYQSTVGRWPLNAQVVVYREYISAFKDIELDILKYISLL